MAVLFVVSGWGIRTDEELVWMRTDEELELSTDEELELVRN